MKSNELPGWSGHAAITAEEAQCRQAVIDEAVTWLRTPWAHNRRVKGAGVDCGLFVGSVYVAVGLLSWSVFLPEGEPEPKYQADWMLHRDEERFRGAFEVFADPVDRPLAGDIALWKYGRCFSHAGIVLDWPQIIHCFRPERGVTYGDATKSPMGTREVCFYSRFARLASEALAADRNAHRENAP